MEREMRTDAGMPKVKPLPPETFVDFREGEATPGDTTGDLGYNAEMRWEAMAGEGYLTPVGSFFVRNHAPTPSMDLASWTLRVEVPGVDCSGRTSEGRGRGGTSGGMWSPVGMRSGSGRPTGRATSNPTRRGGMI